MLRHRSRAPALLVCLFAAACDGSPTTDDVVTEDELTFVRFGETAPSLQSTSVSFYAVRGDERIGRIRYQAQPGEDEGEDFLEFRVSEEALLRYPDGRAFAVGDSVRITVQVVDATRFLFEFSPAGLRFDPQHPARLEVSYEHADRDYDDDGDEDAEDESFEQTFGFWRQERVGLPWVRVGTLKVEDLEEVEADIDGFTRYAVAGN